MSTVQKENFVIINGKIQQLQAAIDKSSDFGALRYEILKLKKTSGDTELHPNARKKFYGWLTKLFYDVNNKEKDQIFSLAQEIEAKLSSIERDFTQGVDLNSVRKDCSIIKKWCAVNQDILTKKPGKTHTVNQDQLNVFIDSFRNLEKRLDEIQCNRTTYFRKKLEEFELNLADFEVQIAELDRDTINESYQNVFEGLKLLQKGVKSFPRKKREKYWERISELFEQLKGIRRESYNAHIQIESQENQTKFENLLDAIEESLDQEIITNTELNKIRASLFNNIWKPLSEKENGCFKFVLIRQHRDNLFNRMRSLLGQIDEKKAGNQAFQAESRENRESMERYLEELHQKFDELRDEFDIGVKMNKGELLRSIGGLSQEIKKYHQQLRTGHFFLNDRREFREALNDLWVDTDNLIQRVKNPEWSFEWLNEKIEKNKRVAGVFLQVVNDIPRPT